MLGISQRCGARDAITGYMFGPGPPAHSKVTTNRANCHLSICSLLHLRRCTARHLSCTICACSLHRCCSKNETSQAADHMLTYSYYLNNLVAAWAKVFSDNNSSRTFLPPKVRYQSSAKSFAVPRLRSLVLTWRSLPSKYVEHCHIELFYADKIGLFRPKSHELPNPSCLPSTVPRTGHTKLA